MHGVVFPDTGSQFGTGSVSLSDRTNSPILKRVQVSAHGHALTTEGQA